MRIGDRCVPGRGAPLTAGNAETLLDEAACGLLQTAADGTILRVNRLFCALLGRPAETLVGKRRLQDLLTMGGRIFHQTHWAPLLQMQGSVSEVRLELVHADGTAIPMLFNARRHEVDGVTLHEVAVFAARDRDKYEQELLRSRKRLEELVADAVRLQAAANDRALLAEQMIGIVSHDLRNPMSTVHIGAALLASTDLTPSQQGTLNRITRSVDRANRLIADLLDFTQARLGRGLGVTLAPLDLHETVSDALDELAFAHPGRTLRHERIGEGECDADGHRLTQAVGNLVANAFVYGAITSPVTVRTAVGAETCSLEVHNEGEPIPIQVQERIFAPMSRGVGAHNAARSVGLGLFIVSEIAKAHGGAATVASSAAAGTTFRLSFARRSKESGAFGA